MFLISLILFAIDRIVKHWAYTQLQGMPGGTMDLLPHILSLTYATNDGVSFGMLSGQAEWLVAVQMSLCAVILVILIKKRDAPILPRLAGWVTLSGAAGNLYDRMRYGYVIDLFEIRLFRFAIFNIADVCLTVGIITFGLWLLLHKENAQSM